MDESQLHHVIRLMHMDRAWKESSIIYIVDSWKLAIGSQLNSKASHAVDVTGRN